MPGIGKQDRQSNNTSVYLDDKHRKMVNTLITAGHYDNFSEMVRTMIEKEFADKLTDPREELKKAKQQLESVIKGLEEYITDIDDLKAQLIDKYRIRRNSLPAKALPEYEKYSKNWIRQNMESVEEVYPGMDVDRVFIELEKSINTK